MMAMPGTVQSVSFSTHRRNTIRLNRPLPLRLLPEWDRTTAAGQEPAGEKTRSLTHLILLANMARRGPLPRSGLVRLAGNVPADAPPRAFVLPTVCADPTLLPYTAGTPSPPEPYTRAVHSPDSMASSAVPTGGGERALQLVSQNILQHGLIQRQLSHELLQLRVLISKLLDLAYLVHVQAGILRLPAIVGLFRNPDLPGHLRYRDCDFGLLQHSNETSNPGFHIETGLRRATLEKECDSEP